MFESFITGLVTKYLNDFCTYDGLVATGIAQLEISKLVVKDSAIPPNLPAKVVRVSIGSLFVSVSALSIFTLNSSYAIKLHVDNVCVHLKNLPDSDLKEFDEFVAVRDAKLAVIALLRQEAIDAIESKLSKLDGTLSVTQSDSSIMGLIKSLGVRMASNVEVTMNSIEIKYDLGDKFLCFNLSQFSMTNCSLDPEINTREDSHGNIIGSLVIPQVQGETAQIVKKVCRFQGLSVTVDKNHLMTPCELEVLFSVNLAANPSPTMGIVESRMSKILIRVSSEDLKTVSRVLHSVSSHAVWKQFCIDRFDILASRGYTMEDQQKAFALYETMIEKGTQLIKHPLVQRPKVPREGSTGDFDVLLSELSWLEAFELRCSTALLQALLKSVSHLVAQKERSKVAKGAATSSLYGRAFSAFGRFFAHEPSKELAMDTAQSLSSALGIVNGKTEEATEEHYRKVFNSIDVNKSGDIDAAELQVGLALAGTSLSVSSINKLMKSLDLNNNGSIDFQEFCEICKLAPSSLNISRYPIFAISIFIEDFEVHLEDQVHFMMNRFRFGTAIENISNLAIGSKGFNISIENISLDVEEKPVIRYQDKSIASQVYQDITKVNVSVSRTTFNKNVPDQHYCMLYELNDLKVPVKHTVSCLASATGKDQFEYSCGTSLMLNRRKRAFDLLLRIQFRQQVYGRNYISKALRFSKTDVIPSKDDPLIDSLDMVVSIPWPTDSSFSRFLDEGPTVFQHVHYFDGGSVVLNIEQESFRSALDLTFDFPPLVQVTGILRTGVGRSECFVGMNVPVCDVFYDEPAIESVAILLSQLSPEEDPQERSSKICDNVILKMQVKNSQTLLKVKCGTVEYNSSEENPAFQLGQLQNLYLMPGIHVSIIYEEDNVEIPILLPPLAYILESVSSNNSFHIECQGLEFDFTVVSTEETSGYMPQQDHDWFERKSADPLGLAVFPSLVERDLCMMNVRVLQAEGLTGSDWLTGSSDPFAIITCRETSFTTATVQRNLNPVWSEEPFQFGPLPGYCMVSSSAETLEISVMDSDFGGMKSELLGVASISLHDLFLKVSQCRPRDSAQHVFDGAKELRLWIPLHPVASQTDSSGKIEIAVRFEDLKMPAQPIPLVPADLELAFFFDITLPTLNLEKLAMTRSKMQLCFDPLEGIVALNGGCCEDLTLEQFKRPLLAKWFKKQNLSVTRHKKTSTVSKQAVAPVPSSCVEKIERPAVNEDHFFEISKSRSVGTIATDDYLSIGSDDEDTLVDTSDPKVILGISKARRTKLSLDVYVDKLGLYLVATSSRTGLPYRSASINMKQMSLSGFYSIFHDRMPSFKITLAIDSMHLGDCVQRHDLVGRDLSDFGAHKRRKSKDAQFQMTVTYDSLLVNPKILQSPTLDIGLVVDRVFILATALVQFHSRVMGHFVSGPVAADVVQVDASPSEAPPILLPISQVNISVGILNVSLHLYKREHLAFKYRDGKPEHKPPQSLVSEFSVRMDYEVKMTDASRTFRKSAGFHVAYLFAESMSMSLLFELSIQRTPLAVHCFQLSPQEIDDFRVGPNVLIQPFHCEISSVLQPLPSFKNKLKLGKKDSTIGFNADYDIAQRMNKYVSNISEYMEEFMDDEEEKKSGIFPDSNVFSKVDVFGVDKYAVEVEREMESKLDAAYNEPSIARRRAVQFKLNSLEIGLEPGDYIFINSITEYHTLLTSQVVESVDTSLQENSSTFLSDEHGSTSHLLKRHSVTEIETPMNFKYDRHYYHVTKPISKARAEAILRGGAVSLKKSRYSSEGFPTLDDQPKDPEVEEEFGVLLPLVCNFLVLCPRTDCYSDIKNAKVSQMDRQQILLKRIRDQSALESSKDKVFTEFDMQFSQILFGVGNNIYGFASPFIRMSVSKFQLIGCSYSAVQQDFFMRGFLLITATSFNNLSKVWEPFMEPWATQIGGERSKEGTYLQCLAPHRLNINVTDGLLQQLSVFNKCWSGNVDPLIDPRLSGSFCPNWVINETGHVLDIWPVLDAKRQSESICPQYVKYRGEIQRTQIEDGNVARLHLHDTSMVRGVASSLISQLEANKRRLAMKAIRFLKGNMRPVSLNLQRAVSTKDFFTREELVKAYEALFHYLDEDGSGEINAVELHRALSRSGEPISIDQIVYMIGELDEEGVENADAVNTSIDMEEFLNFFIPKTDGTAQVFTIEALCLDVFGFPNANPSVNSFVFAPCSNQGYTMIQSSHSLKSNISNIMKNVLMDAFNGFTFPPTGITERKYEFKSHNPTIQIVANNRKKGKASVSDVLILETPVRFENRALVSLKFVLVVNDTNGDTLREDHVFTLEPGEERSVPLYHLYVKNIEPQASGVFVAVQPLVGAEGRLKMNAISAERWNKAHKFQHRSVSAESMDDSGEAQEHSWNRSRYLVELLCGQSVKVVPPFRPEDDFLNRLSGAPIYDFFSKSKIDSGVVGATRVSLSKDESSFTSMNESQDNLELTMMTQRNAMPSYALGETFSVQIVEATGLLAADANGTSDPYVRLYFGDKKEKSPTVHNTLDPVWPRCKFTFTGLQFDDKYPSMRFLVKDHDTIGQDDILGEVHVLLDDIREFFNQPIRPAKVSKSFHLATVEGMDKEARGILYLNFEYRTFSSDGSKFNIQHVFSFYPAFLMENLLPVPVQVEITNTEGRSQVYSIPVGTDIPIYNVDGAMFDHLDPVVGSHISAILSQSLKKADAIVRYTFDKAQEQKQKPGGLVRFRFMDEHTGKPISDWTDNVSLPNKPVYVAREGSCLSSVFLEVTRDIQDGGARRLIMYAPYWIVNKSDLLLQYNDSAVTNKRMWLQPTQSSLDLAMITCMCFENQQEELLNVRAKPGNYPSNVWMHASRKLDLANDDNLVGGLSSFVSLQCRSLDCDISKIPEFTDKNPQTKCTTLLVMVQSLVGFTGMKADCSYAVSAVLSNSHSSSHQISFAAKRESDTLTWDIGEGVIAIRLPLDLTSKSNESLSLSILEKKLQGDLISVGDTKIPFKSVIDQLESSSSQVCTMYISVQSATLSVAFRHVGRLCSTDIMPGSFNYGADIALRVEQLYGKNKRTRVLTISPKFMMANMSQEPILIKQVGCPDATALYLPGFFHENRIEGTALATPSPFHFQVSPSSALVVSFVTTRVQVALAHPGAPWTNPFPLDDIDDFGLQLRLADNQRGARLWVDANSSGPSNYFVFRSLSFETTPFAVQNLSTDSTFALVQVPAVRAGVVSGVKQVFTGKSPLFHGAASRHGKTMASLQYDPDILEPMQELAMAQDILPLKRGVRVTVLVIPVGINGELKLGDAHQVRFKHGVKERIKLSSGKLGTMQVVSEGSRLVLRLQDHGINISKEEKATLQLQKIPGISKQVTRKHTLYSLLKPTAPNLECLVSLSSVGISLFSTRHSTEIAYIFFQRIHVELSKEMFERDFVVSERTSIEFSLGNFQVDSSLCDQTTEKVSMAQQEKTGGKFPVVISINSTPTSSAHYSCDICLKHFSSNRRLNLHMKSRHRSLLYTKSELEVPPYPLLSVISEKAKEQTQLLSDSERKKRFLDDAIQLHRVMEREVGVSNAFDIVRHLEVKIKPVHVYIDGAFLAGMLMLLDETVEKGGSIEGEGQVLGSQPVSDSGKSWFLAETGLQVARIPIPEQDSIFVENIDVQETAVNITVNIGQGNKLSSMLQPYGISPLTLTVAKRVARVDLFNLDISSSSYSGLTLHNVMNKLQSGVTTDILSQLHEVLFNFTKRIGRRTGLTKYKAFQKIREPLVSQDDFGAIDSYGPGALPKDKERQLEKKAAVMIERWYYSKIQERKHGDGQERNPPENVITKTNSFCC